jgi:Holliday junction DNA helicase RuvB
MLDGIAGGGKTTIANIIAKELNFVTHKEFIEENAKQHKTPKNREYPERMLIHCGITTNFTDLLVELFQLYKPTRGIIPHRIFFIDEVHALPKAKLDMLLTVIENQKLIMSINGVNKIKDLPYSTWIIATTNPEKINGPFKNRFRHHITFYPYDQEEMEQIASKNLQKLNLTLDSDSISMLAKISRQTPRTLNGNILNLLDYTSLINSTSLTYSTFSDFLRYVGIDQHGLSERDRMVIKSLGECSTTSALPLRTLATVTGIDEETLTSEIEPYLMRTGVIQVTTRGRMLTQHGDELYKELET